MARLVFIDPTSTEFEEAPMNGRLQLIALAIFMTTSLPCVGCGSAPGEGKKVDPGTPVELADAVRKMSADAGIETDDALKAYAAKNQLPASFVGPKTLRSLAQIAESERLLFGRVGFRSDEEKITLIWSGAICILGDESEGTKILLSSIKGAGLTETAGKLTSHLAEEYENRVKASEKAMADLNIKYNPAPGWWTFSRKVGGTTEELLVRDFREGPGGKRNRCYGDYEWCVTCGYAGKVPALRTLLKGMPVLQPIDYGDGLLDRLQNEPAYALLAAVRQSMPPSGFELITSATAQADVEKILKDRGFTLGRPVQLPHYRFGAAEQHCWTRASDWSPASVITFKTNKDRIGVIRGGPQKPAEKSN